MVLMTTNKALQHLDDHNMFALQVRIVECTSNELSEKYTAVQNLSIDEFDDDDSNDDHLSSGSNKQIDKYIESLQSAKKTVSKMSNKLNSLVEHGADPRRSKLQK